MTETLNPTDDRDTPQGELHWLQTVRLPELTAVVDAGAGQDAADQADVYAALTQIAEAQDRITQLQSQIAREAAEVAPVGARNVAVPGRLVTLDFGDGPEESLFVSEGGGLGRISITSPVGAAILNRKSGDVVDVVVPRGVTTPVTIVSVRDR